MVPSDVDVDVPTRNDVLTLLADVMEHASKRESEHLNPLFDVLYMACAPLVMSSTEDALITLKATVAEFPAPRRGTQGAAWVALSEAMAAFGAEKWTEAIASFKEGLDQRALLGGSSEQLDILEEALVESLLCASKFDEAEAILRKRIAARPSIPINYLQLARSLQHAESGSDASADVSTALQQWQRLRAVQGSA